MTHEHNALLAAGTGVKLSFPCVGPAEYPCPAKGRPRSVLTMGLDLQGKAHPRPAGPLLRRLPWSTLLQGCKAVRGPDEGGDHLRRDGAPGEEVTCCGTASPMAAPPWQCPHGSAPVAAPAGSRQARGGGGGAVASRTVPSRAPPARPPHLAAAWSASRQSRPLAQDVSHIRISASVGSRARPYHSARGGSSMAAPSCSALWPSRPCCYPPPRAVGLSWGGRGQTACGAAPGRRGAGADRAAPPSGAGGASPVTSAGGYKTEARRGTPAAQAAPAVERRDARRGPAQGRTQPTPPRFIPKDASPPSHQLSLSACAHRADMMYQGFAGEYEAPSSRCSSASPAGDSLTYYPSPADSFSSMGSPVNPQVSCRACRLRSWPGQERSGRDGTGAGGAGLAVSAEEVRLGTGMGSGPGVEAGRSGGAVARAALCGGCVKRLH